MKKLLLAIVMMAGISIANAQTKWTSTVGLGLGFNKQKVINHFQDDWDISHQKSSYFSLGYGMFFRDNQRLGIEFSSGDVNNINTANFEISQVLDQKMHGGKLTYQKYYPLLKKLYAFGGGSTGYENLKSDIISFNGPHIQSNKIKTKTNSNSYSLSGYGGVTWFLSKRIAFEADILSANLNYIKAESYGYGENVIQVKNTSSSLNLSTTGAINNLAFKIYLLL